MSYWKNLPHLKHAAPATAGNRARWLTGLLLTSLLCAAPASAKFDDYLTKRWFTIEVIVFERSNIDDKNTLEALAHPLPTSEEDTPLLEGDEDIAANKPELIELSAEDAPSILDLAAHDLSKQRQNLELPSTNDDAAAEQLRLDLLQALDNYELELAERNLVFQTDANPVLEEELERLSRGRNNNVLWRGHWLQAVPRRTQPQPLEIAVNPLESGELQLSGSLEVTVSRYLHLKAHLRYHDPAFAELLIGDAAAGYQSAPSAAAPIEAPRVDPRGTLLETSAPQEQARDPMQPEPLFMQLEEARRMRSGYLHYLDHPKLGLLVRIDKVPPPPDLLAQYKAFESSQK